MFTERSTALQQGDIVREVLLIDNSADNAEYISFDDAKVKVLRSDKALDCMPEFRMLQPPRIL